MTNLCKSCNCMIYIREPVDNILPGVLHRDNYYCTKCIDAVYFIEDIDREDTSPIVKKKEPIVHKHIITCPVCNIQIDSPDKKCNKCGKIHPLYVRKTKKKRKKK